MGSVGQVNYAAAKAGVVALTQVAAVELARYGVTVNAIAPVARTAMTETVFADTMRAPDERLRRDGAGERVAARGVAAAARTSGDVTGRVFEVSRRRGQPGRRLAARRGRPTPAGGGTRRSWAPWCATCSREAPAPAPVYGA